MIGNVLDFDPPELVVLNGDLINGDTTWADNSTHYIDQIVAPIIQRNLTWASTYGNHDHSYYSDGDEILKREQLWSGARTQKMVSTKDAGTTNYYLPVYSSSCTGDSCSPELILWFFDSRGGYYFQGDPQGNWVDTSVVTWFNETNASLVKKHGAVIPSLAFVHIPINATWAAQTEVGLDPHYQPGINAEAACAQQGAGWCSNNDIYETCDYGAQDVPFMQALVAVPGIMGLFYGHDHGQSWCYKWDSLLPGMTIEGNGLNLCYGQHSGYGGYGDWIRGARQIVVTQDKLKDFAVDTHIRLESGQIVGAVSLNSTFNKNSYPATPNQLTYMDDISGGVVNVFLSSSAPGIYNSMGGYYYTMLWNNWQAAVAYLGIWALILQVVL